MTTLPPPKVKQFPDDSLEKKVYNIIESFKDNLPIMNDRNRLAFSLYKYLKGEGDAPLMAVKTNKLKIVGLSEEELAKRIDEELKKIK
ncbi:Hypothetical protein IALB_2636 [Ignavibacterium album JCM 16511]|uniref:Uncharacterized protein n=1 Tax=Ignavibacterium album (strain DSM 19864 / JCM 16511 / NBRC 101810 / Mat9-16) TaxID=945713 RepID=I0AMY2_IGNAJ|nr:hypothetical protein [Ignavibacterium album]AFH50339.1 Hypothetical protein IALB_2636 [Ignavibacterium album JCM 16511]